MKVVGQKTDALVKFVGIYPSLVKRCGLPLSPGLEGRSFVPLLNNPNATWDKVAFSEYPKGGYHGTAMRTERYRNAEWRKKQEELVATELYDHVTDLQENENLAVKPEHAELLKELAARRRRH